MPFSMHGKVVKGYQEGKKLGYPTANLAVAAEKIVPAEGVYATKVSILDATYDAMTYIGRRPTMHNGNDCSIETNIFGFNGNLYGQDIAISFIARLRDDIRFNSHEALKAKLANDEQAAKKALATYKDEDDTHHV